MRVERAHLAVGAQVVNAALFRAVNHHGSIYAVMDAVCKEFMIDRAQLLSERKMREVTLPRMVGYWLAKKVTTLGLKAIAREFKRRDHTTVVKGCQRIDELIKTDHEIKYAVDNLMRDLGYVITEDNGDRPYTRRARVVGAAQ